MSKLIEAEESGTLEPFDKDGDGEETSRHTFSRRCKTRTEEFFNDSSFHGILYPFASKSWIKRILWAVIILTAIGGFLIVSYINFSLLAREPISTSITLARKKEITLPAVTICSLSLLNITTVESGGFNIQGELNELFNDIMERSNIQTCKSHANRLASTTGQNISWGELIDIAQNNISALLMNCSFAGKKCSAEDFEPIHTIGGRCYTFNRVGSRVVKDTGIRQGLHLLLSPYYQFFSLEGDIGFRVVIHNPDELPRPESEGIVVGLNSSVYIGMKRIISIDKTKFSSGFQCRKDTYNQHQDLSIPGYTSYSPSSCQAQCLYEYVIKKCGCIEKNFYTPVSSLYSQLRTCGAPDLCCAVEAFYEVKESCDCPPRCETVEHSLTISSSTSNSDSVVINVYYESLILETRETTDSYTPWSLISDIGGNTGLFLGITLLSGVELMLLLLGFIKDCCCCYKNKWKQSSKL